MGGSQNREGEAPVAQAQPMTVDEGDSSMMSRAAEAAVTDLDRIYRENRQRVLRAAYRVTGNSQDAEDVLQTVFLRIARREGGSPLSDSPGSYLHRAAINAALDIIRSRQSAKATALEDVEPVLESGEPDPEQRQDGKQIEGLIRAALANVSPKAAEMFALRYFEGFGNHEIARMLGASRSTVNVILHRTRAKIREEIADHVGESR